MAATQIPTYRRQKEKNRPDRAFVVIDGKRHQLGQYGTAESRQRYDRLINEWLANGRRLPDPDRQLTVTELIAQFVSVRQNAPGETGRWHGDRLLGHFR